MSRYVFDIETNGLLDQLDRIHCIVIADPANPAQRVSYGPGEIDTAVEILQKADEIIGHHIMGFDIPAIQKVYPGWQPEGKVTDTLVLSRLIWADMKDRDLKLRAKREKRRQALMPGWMIGRHSLESWGHRLGYHKGDYAKEMKAKGLDPWAEFNDHMLSYCENDVDLNVKLLQKIDSKNYSQAAMDLEHAVWAICLAQMGFGCAFNEKLAAELYGELCARRSEVDTKLRDLFGRWFRPRERKTVKRSMRRFVANSYGKPIDRRKRKKDPPDIQRGWFEELEEGTKHTKIELVEFNPSSRSHIANRLMKLRGWKPHVFTPTKEPQIDETILAGLPYPEVPLLIEHLMLAKRIGQVAEGKEAWLKLVKKDGRIYGRIDTNGAVTGRATHSRPNLAQVPASRAEYGETCRSCFIATPGFSFVGADASGLELRCLAHYMARWDDGEYAEQILNGDIHTMNQQAAGLATRDMAKTFIYAFLYGAGNAKIGAIIGKGAQAGAALRKRFLTRLPALGELSTLVKKKASRNGFVVGLDGRRLQCRSPHSSLNTLLQGAGGIIMKKAMVNYHQVLRNEGLDHGADYRQILWVHDEFQNECRPEVADRVGSAMVEGIRQVTNDYDLRIPLDGEYKVGTNWSHTH